MWLEQNASNLAQLPPMRPLDNYSWFVPPAAGCAPYHAFDRRDFCVLLRGRDVLLIGDSLTHQFSNSFWNMAGARLPLDRRPRDWPDSISFPYRMPISWPPYAICEDLLAPSRVTTLLNWARGDLLLKDNMSHRSISHYCGLKDIDMNSSSLTSLSLIPGSKCPHFNVTPGSARDRIWGVDEFVGEFARSVGLAPGLIILNAGAHFQEDGVLIPQVRAALAVVVATHPSATVVWRNTPPGHAGCGNMTVPLTEPQRGTLPFHWGEFARQNALIEREFPSVIYLDVASSTALRGDFHLSSFDAPPSDRDCVHYMQPGPQDEWVRALYRDARCLASLRRPRAHHFLMRLPAMPTTHHSGGLLRADVARNGSAVWLQGASQHRL